MEITEIRIKLMESSEDRLRAFCSITIDQCFVIRDLKIIDGANGPFVAMPSRKLTGHCQRCGQKNHLRAGYCNHCGTKLSIAGNIPDSPQKLYADVAHPINSECREMIQDAVVAEFQAELDRSSQPGYRSRYDDDFDAGDYDAGDYDEAPAAGAAATANAAVDKHADRTVRRLDDQSVARGDKVGEASQSVPRPHFQDNRGGSRGSVVTTNDPRTGGAAERPTSPNSQPDSVRDDSQDGFGAGIFDA